MGHQSIAKYTDDDGFEFIIGGEYQHRTLGRLTFVGFSEYWSNGYFRDSENVVKNRDYDNFIRPTVTITLNAEDVEFLKNAVWYTSAKPGDVPRQNRIIGAIMQAEFT